MFHDESSSFGCIVEAKDHAHAHCLIPEDRGNVGMPNVDVRRASDARWLGRFRGIRNFETTARRPPRYIVSPAL